MEFKESILEDIKAEEIEVPYFQRLLINVVDAAIEIVILIGLYFLLPKEILNEIFAVSSLMKYAVTFIVLIAYRMICILLIGKTIGMIICKSKYLNSNLLPLTSKERITAVFLTRTSGIKNYRT